MKAMTDDEQEHFEERAAIMEFCADLPRTEAEYRARESIHLSKVPAPQRVKGPLKPCAESALNALRKVLR